MGEDTAWGHPYMHDEHRGFRDCQVLGAGPLAFSHTASRTRAAGTFRGSDPPKKVHSKILESGSWEKSRTRTPPEKPTADEPHAAVQSSHHISHIL